jgi:hypothetical protein
MIVHNPLTAEHQHKAGTVPALTNKALTVSLLDRVKFVGGGYEQPPDQETTYPRETCGVYHVKLVGITPLNPRETCGTSNYLTLLLDSITGAVKEKRTRPGPQNRTSHPATRSFFFHQRGFQTSHSHCDQEAQR